MSIRVERKIDFNRLAEARMERVRRAFGPAISDEVTRMIQRTRGGTDVKGNAFKPYTKAYAEHKAEKGRNRNVDLTFTGKMLAAITHTIRNAGSRIEATVSFNSAAEANKARWNLGKRKFFGFSEEQFQRIQRKIKESF